MKQITKLETYIKKGEDVYDKILTGAVPLVFLFMVGMITSLIVVAVGWIGLLYVGLFISISYIVGDLISRRDE